MNENMVKIVKSIFRRREVEILYELKTITKEENKGYILTSTTELKAYENTDNVISDNKIGEYCIEIPLLEIGDEFFLHDIQELVKIKSRTRSSDGSIIYYTEDKPVITNNTLKSKEECYRKIGNWYYTMERFEKLQNDYMNLRAEFKEYKEKYKYEHKFFNNESSDCL